MSLEVEPLFLICIFASYVQSVAHLNFLMKYALIFRITRMDKSINNYILVLRHQVFDASIPDRLTRVLVERLALEWVIEEIFFSLAVEILYVVFVLHHGKSFLFRHLPSCMQAVVLWTTVYV